MRNYISLLMIIVVATSAAAHDAHDDAPAPARRSVIRLSGSGASNLVTPLLLAQGVDKATSPDAARSFEAFKNLNVRWDESFLYVESSGIPDHRMMVGITAWQQQVPLPQPYTGDNAWRIPLAPIPAKEPVSIKGRFLRGAIALAANGIPIFNPQNNRGEISAEIGELDEFGGHCGRADDYHYHAAPLHLQSAVGKGRPIAYALDGYAILGLTEPDGTRPAAVDAFNGHTTAALGYHYHASTKYPYVNGGFHGEVVERGGQVDPQPRAQPIRPAMQPLRGAKITAFESAANGYKLTYEVAGDKRAILYSVNPDGSIPFEYQSGTAGTTREVYKRPKASEGSPPRARQADPPAAAADPPQKPDGAFTLTSPEVTDGGNLPPEFTGDGAGATLPLAWKGAPPGTKSYALVMDHLAPGNVMKGYWNVWDIPVTVTSLPKNAKDVGKVGVGFKGEIGYEPPHSKGPGAKTYVLTIYALSEELQINRPPREVNREVLLAAMKGKVLASAALHVVYTRGVSP